MVRWWISSCRESPESEKMRRRPEEEDELAGLAATAPGSRLLTGTGKGTTAGTRDTTVRHREDGGRGIDAATATATVGR